MNTDRRHEKRYWRSPERLLESPGARAEPADAFPPGAAAAPDGLSRRAMLGLMGASFSLAGLAACRRPVETIVPYVEAPEEGRFGIPEHFATTMTLGSSACGLLVESHEGRPTKVEGNALHPSSLGAANAWMQASILGLYDPDRSRRVRRRDAGGEAGDAGWDDLAALWQSLAPELEARRGAGLAVLSEAYTSPTLARLRARLQKRFPAALWAVCEPQGDESLFRGLETAAGEPLRPLYHLERARVVVALDADLLAGESEALVHARGFAAARADRERPSRLYAVESTLTLTGAMADHRLPLPSRDVPSLALALARRLLRLGLPLDPAVAEAALPPLDGALEARLDLIAEDLLAARGAALVAAGRAQPPAVHALVLAMNQALGAVGRTVTLVPLTDVGWGGTEELVALVEAMRRGEVDTLVMLGGNPAYNAPADLGFADALGQVPHSLHLSDRVDETSALAGWHLPRAHFLEAWGDARAADGTPSVAQPLIAPLHGGKSAVEILGLLTDDRLLDGYRRVRDTWLDGVLGNEDFESRWNRVLHDGLLADAAAVPLAPTLAEGAIARACAAIARRAGTPGQGLEAVFHLSPSVHDGRFANNGWLQEMPDPITKLAWDAAVRLGPATAADLGVRTGERLRLTLGERSVEAPLLVLPGQAEGSVALELGYGRGAAGRVGDGVGADLGRLRRWRAPYVDQGLHLEKTGESWPLAQTQEHWSMEGRALVREATVAEYRAHPDFAGAPEADLEIHQLWPPHETGSGHRWGMTIDLDSCIGCNACVVACQSENNVPIVGKEQVSRGREMHWLRVDRYVSGTPEAPEVVFQPVPCMQCENAPCEQVCPVGATLHDGEGLNAMVYNRCIGTRYCSNNCPYKVRRFNFFNYTRELPELVQLAQNPDVTVRSRGVMEKCTYCVQRLHEGKRQAKREGRQLADGEIRTACQQTCPTDAIVFGDLADAGSRVVQRKADPRNYDLLAELGNRPRTSYLAKLRNPHPRWA